MIVTRINERMGKERTRRFTRRLKARHTLEGSGIRIALRPTPTTKDATAFNKSSLFPNEHHTCLMAKEKKVNTRNATTYASSSDDESSDDEVDYASLFKGLDRTKIDKINELIDALNEKNRVLEKQEDLLYEEHDKFVSAQNSLALEVKRNEMLSCELSTCHESISSLKSINDELNAKLEIANKSTSCVEHVEICNRCKDFNVDACSEHLVSISKLKDEVASLNAQLKTSKSKFDKLKFAWDAYTIGRHPSIKDGLGFKREAKNLTSHKAPISAKEKGKAPMANSAQKTMLSCTMIGDILGMFIEVMMLLILMP
jgi:hypothetical protein